MFPVTIIRDGQEEVIVLNQKHVCSFKSLTIDKKEITEIRMSNGDIWHVVDPPYKNWFPDSFTTSEEY